MYRERRLVAVTFVVEPRSAGSSVPARSGSRSTCSAIRSAWHDALLLESVGPGDPRRGVRRSPARSARRKAASCCSRRWSDCRSTSALALSLVEARPRAGCSGCPASSLPAPGRAALVSGARRRSRSPTSACSHDARDHPRRGPRLASSAGRRRPSCRSACSAFGGQSRCSSVISDHPRAIIGVHDVVRGRPATSRQRIVAELARLGHADVETRGTTSATTLGSVLTCAHVRPTR